MTNNVVRILIALVVGLLLIAGLLWLSNNRSADNVTPTPEVAQCPQATPEYFGVYPVTSPTSELAQTISVELGNGEFITITTESGVFAAPATSFPTEITIDLLPDTTHALTVEGRVQQVQHGECTYGGYVLSTRQDREGQPLIIDQQQP